MIRLLVAVLLASAAMVIAAVWNVWAPLGLLAGWGAMDMVSEFRDAWADR